LVSGRLPPGGRPHRRSGAQRLRDNLAGYAFISPWLVGFLLFTVVPMIISLAISFMKYDLVNRPAWVGAANFVRLFARDPRFLRSVRITLLYVSTAVPLRLVFALVIALVLAGRHRLVGLYRLVYYLPSIVGGSVAVAIVWRELLGYHGPVNEVARWFVPGAGAVSLIGNPRTALASVILLYVWQFGSSMLIFLAGLKNIPVSYYESAVIDGAGAAVKFTRITLPLLTPVILFNLVMQTINGFMVFTQALIITNGGPMDATLVYVLYMYRRGFTFHDMGAASAMALMLFAAMAAVAYLLFRSSRAWVYYETEGR
jgi:multiple sugar transport system permease protein